MTVNSDGHSLTCSVPFLAEAKPEYGLHQLKTCYLPRSTPSLFQYEITLACENLDDLDQLYLDMGMADERPDDVMHRVCDPVVIV